VFVRVVVVKSNDRTKYVELVVECFWTRVRFPPPPPEHRVKLHHQDSLKTRKRPAACGFFVACRFTDRAHSE
jgi:hypothetical protein